MENTGLNINEIRNLNKIRVFGVEPRDAKTHFEKGSTPIFEAYLTSPLGDFKAGSNVNSLTQQIGDFFKGFGIVGSIATSAVGSYLTNGSNAGLINTIGSAFELANEINYNFHYRYNGTQEFNKTFQCELVVKDDFIEDIINPLWSLLEYVLPSETQTTGGTDIYQTMEKGVADFYTFLTDSVNGLANKYIKSDTVLKLTKSVGSKVDNSIRKVGNTANDIASSISGIYKPKQLDGSYSHTRILIGDYIAIDDVVITDVNFNVPYLFYEGGLFDRIGVSLSVKGNRKMTLKTYDWLKNIKNGHTFEMAQRNARNAIQPLNNRYENSFDSNKSMDSLRNRF